MIQTRVIRLFRRGGYWWITFYGFPRLVEYLHGKRTKRLLDRDTVSVEAMREKMERLNPGVEIRI